MWRYLCVIPVVALIGCALPQREVRQHSELVLTVRSPEAQAHLPVHKRPLRVEASVETTSREVSTDWLGRRRESEPCLATQRHFMAVRVGGENELRGYVSLSDSAPRLMPFLTHSGKLVFGTPVASGLLLRAEIEAYDEATDEGTITVEFAVAGEGEPEFFVSEEHIPFRLGEPFIRRESEGVVSGRPAHPEVEEILSRASPPD